jgi:hypothetical protein
LIFSWHLYFCSQVQESEVVVIGFFTSETDAEAAAFVQAAELGEDTYAFTISPDVAAHYGVTAPKVIALKKVRRHCEISHSSLTRAAMNSLVNLLRLPLASSPARTSCPTCPSSATQLPPSSLAAPSSPTSCSSPPRCSADIFYFLCQCAIEEEACTHYTGRPELRHHDGCHAHRLQAEPGQDSLHPPRHRCA